MLECLFDASATKRGRVSALFGFIALSPVISFGNSAQAQSANGASALPPVVVEQSDASKREVTTPRNSRSASAGRARSRTARQAQVAPQPTPVAAERGTDPVRGFVPYVSSAAMKSDTRILETPQSVSVVSRDQLDARSVTTLVEGLQYVAGLAVQPGGKDPRYDNVFIRGFDVNGYGAYRDGLREVGDPNFFSLFRSEPYGFERIDVIKGPSRRALARADLELLPRMVALNDVRVVHSLCSHDLLSDELWESYQQRTLASLNDWTSGHAAEELLAI